MRRTIAGAVTFTTALTLGLIATPATAADHANGTAALIEQVAPDQGGVVAATAAADGISATVRSTEVTLPTAGTGDVDIAGLRVSLPDRVEARALIAGDGTVVYPGSRGGTTAAVQILEDASVRLQTITPDAKADRSFSYAFAGLRPVVRKDGSVELLEDQGGISVVRGVVAPAWARDAAGRPVATSYRVEGDSLVQTIVPTARTAYPVVADPKVTKTWWNWTVYLNKRETNNVAAGASVAVIVGPFVPAVGPIIAAGAGAVQAVAQYAQGRGSCLKLVAYVTGAALPQSYGGSEAGGYCK